MSSALAVPPAEPDAADAHRPHLLHSPDRVWPETNCYVDLWIELLHLRGCAPEAMFGFTLRQDFEGDQFTFFKPSMSEIERLYGLRLEELSVYDDLEMQIATQVSQDRIVLVEVDAFHLPDTLSTTYGNEHSKTTIGVVRIDPAARRLDYLHNAGRFHLSGADYDGVFAPAVLPPYAEFVKRTSTPLDAGRLADAATELLRAHHRCMPGENPIRRFRAAFETACDALVRRPLPVFHRYAFNTTRQLGANFELLGSHLAWLADRSAIDLSEAATRSIALAQGAKTFQFHLARGFSKRSANGLAGRLDALADTYDALSADLGRALG